MRNVTLVAAVVVYVLGDSRDYEAADWLLGVQLSPGRLQVELWSV